MALFCFGVQGMASGQNGMVLTGMALVWRRIADAAVRLNQCTNAAPHWRAASIVSKPL
jgi:hypothetical protein